MYIFVTIWSSHRIHSRSILILFIVRVAIFSISILQTFSLLFWLRIISYVFLICSVRRLRQRFVDNNLSIWSIRFKTSYWIFIDNTWLSQWLPVHNLWLLFYVGMTSHWYGSCYWSCWSAIACIQDFSWFLIWIVSRSFCSDWRWPLPAFFCSVSYN